MIFRFQVSGFSANRRSRPVLADKFSNFGHRLSVFRHLSLYLVLGILYFFSGCKKDKIAVDLGYAYFPNTIGHYVIYQIDSTAQDDPSHIDTTYKFQIKEVIESIYMDNSGRPTMRIERYRKKYDPLVPYNLQAWTGPHIFAANLTKTAGERVEENIRYTRVIFPVKTGVTWNENAANTFESWSSKYSSVDQAETVNSFSFDSVSTVEEENVINFVETKYALSKYAKHIGLIYRQLILVSKQPVNTSDTVPFDDTLALPAYVSLSNKAILYTQKVIGWGN